LGAQNRLVLVGERITWAATVSDGPTAGLVYQFSDGPVHGPFHVARDFSPDNHFTWAPMEEGRYKIMVTVKPGFAATDAESAVALDVVNSRVTGSDAVITAMSNPLVALYSAPPVSEETMHVFPHELVHVEFAVASAQPSWRSTNELPSEPGKSTNFLVAGMLPNTTYEMRHVLEDGTASAPLLFTTGNLPTTLSFPTFTVQQQPGPGSDDNEDMIFHQLTKSPSNVPNPLATDLQGHVLWYYDLSHAGLTFSNPAQSLVPGGTVLLIGADQYAALPGSRNILREIDLAGNSIRETNLDAVNAQLTAMGHNVIYSFTHDVQRLPNGGTAVIGLVERTVNINGALKDYVGAMILVLDKNLQVAWTWDVFDHLDVNRGPVLGEVLQPGSPQPTASVPRLPAVDWLHLNAVSWSPADQNLVLSIRHQDWVIKIDYRNGEGDGHVIWRLGQGGDFTVNSTDPNPWFSHQHNAHYIDDTTMVVFDNGNTRLASDPNAHSRGQVWKLDEETMTATLVVNADLGSYSGALGAAQRLSNGDYSFTLGENGPEPPRPPAQTIEVTPDGTKVYDLMANRPEHRSYRVRTLYEGTNPPLAPSFVADRTVDMAALVAGLSAPQVPAPSWRETDPALNSRQQQWRPEVAVALGLAGEQKPSPAALTSQLAGTAARESPAFDALFANLGDSLLNDGYGQRSPTALTSQLAGTAARESPAFDALFANQGDGLLDDGYGQRSPAALTSQLAGTAATESQAFDALFADLGDSLLNDGFGQRTTD
jgi:arylsulfate sulfotransferase